MKNVINSDEKKLTTLKGNKQKWCRFSEKEKIILLKKCMKNLQNEKEVWVNLCANAKKIPPQSQTIGQEWISGPAVLMRAFRILQTSLKQNAKPQLKLSKNSSDQTVATVLPYNLSEALIFLGISAEIHIQKDKPATQGVLYNELQSGQGKVCLILGAGNVASMPALDLLHKLFTERAVCLLKFNPINDYIKDVFAKIFKPFIDLGFLELTTGDKETGQFLCAHEDVDEIHVTGSYETYQAICQYPKNITAELGCVSPAVIVPGDWTEKEVLFQAKHIASAVENNASFNCNAVKVLVLGKNWPQKEEFLKALRAEFEKMPLRYAYYPGSEKRHQSFLEKYPQAELFGESKEGTIPWTLIPNIPVTPNEYALNFEAFCGVLGVVELDTKTTEEFLIQCVETCNKSIWGNLSCTFIIDEKTQKTHKVQVKNALSHLKYGSIGVNCWAAVSYGLFGTTWGAFPEKDVKSGTGVINNGYFFDFPEKSIIRSPFKPLLKPIWFHDHKNLVKVAKNLVNFEYSQSFTDFCKLTISAL